MKINITLKVPILALIICVAFLLQGCGKSKLISTWVSNSTTDYHIDKVLVIAIMQDPINRQIYEDSFVSLLQKSGAKAFAGSTYNLDTEKPTKDEIATAVSKTGASSILITHILSNTTDTYTVPPMDDYVAYFGSWSSVTGAHTYVYDRTFAPAETTEERDERMVVTLFASGGGKPIWSAVSNSVNLELRLRSDDENLEELFINSLKEKNLL